MQPLIEAETTPSGKLRAYLASNLAFLASRRMEVTAVVEIVSNARNAEGGLRFSDDADQSILRPLIGLLRWGEREGAFRSFSGLGVKVMAVTIRSAIDGVGAQLARNPDLNVDAYAQELVTLF